MILDFIDLESKNKFNLKMQKFYQRLNESKIKYIKSPIITAEFYKRDDVYNNFDILIDFRKDHIVVKSLFDIKDEKKVKLMNSRKILKYIAVKKRMNMFAGKLELK